MFLFSNQKYLSVNPKTFCLHKFSFEIKTLLANKMFLNELVLLETKPSKFLFSNKTFLSLN